MLDDIVALLACPVCGGGLSRAAGALRCPTGHSFDIARQGYVNLLPGGARVGTADTADMVHAREEFLGGGHFAPLAEVVADHAADVAARARSGCVLDAGAGTGSYLRLVLDRLGDRAGIALDVSTYALRRAARAHTRIGAVAWDLWRPFPVRAGVAALVLNVFAPRNPAEFRRVLRADGGLVVVTPATGHLAELVAPLGLISMDARKEERLAATLRGHFALEAREEHRFAMRLDHAAVRALAGMGPSARHLGAQALRARVARLPDPVEVTAAVTLSRYRPL